MKLKTSNVILSAAVASALLAMGGAANAGTLAVTTARTFATENFGSSFSAAATIVPGGGITYSMSNATNVNGNTAVFFVVRLTNAKFVGTPAATSFTFAGTAASATTWTYVGTPSSDRTTLQVSVTPSVSASLGIGAFSYTPTTGEINAVGALGTAATTVTATIAVTTTTTTATNLDSTNALPTTVDAPAPTATMATSASAISGSIDPTMSAYDGRIDLTATPPSSAYRRANGTAITNVALGTVTFADTTGTQGQYLASGTDYTIAAGSTGGALASGTIVVTPGTGQAFPIGARLGTDTTGSTCTALGTTTAAFTATTSTTAATITVAAATIANTAPIFICMTPPSTNNTASPITPTITATLGPVNTADIARSVTGTGFALVLNGSQTDVRNYLPAALTGYTAFLRIINTGSVAAPISAAVINETTGAVGTAGTLISSLPAGAATTLSSTQIEAVIGAQAASARPRIRISGATNGLDVQSYALTPNGWATVMGKE